MQQRFLSQIIQPYYSWSLPVILFMFYRPYDLHFNSLYTNILLLCTDIKIIVPLKQVIVPIWFENATLGLNDNQDQYSFPDEVQYLSIIFTHWFYNENLTASSCDTFINITIESYVMSKLCLVSDFSDLESLRYYTEIGWFFVKYKTVLCSSKSYLICLNMVLRAFDRCKLINEHFKAQLMKAITLMGKINKIKINLVKSRTQRAPKKRNARRLFVIRPSIITLAFQWYNIYNIMKKEYTFIYLNCDVELIITILIKTWR